LTKYGKCCEPVDLGMVRDDDVEAMTKTIQAGMDVCDVIITTGVSMGETDIVEHVLVDKCGGTLQFGRMHMKPGKPTTFVTLPSRQDDGAVKLVFAMPGNPVSATVCTQLLVKPCLELYFRGVDKAFSVTAETEQLEEIVEESFVHPEILARLAHDVKLDNKRPEYHRVQLAVSVDGTYVASTTGVQQSSRLMSLRDAEGLMVLPHAHGVKTKAQEGESYPVLLLNNALGKEPVRIRDSIHLKKPAKGVKIEVVEVVPADRRDFSKLEEICVKVQDALTGSKSGSASVVAKRIFSGSADELYSSIVDEFSKEADVIVVSCDFDKFQFHLDVSNNLRKRLSKNAESLAMQARQGAASEDPKAALFEVVVGYVPEKQGAMLICVPDTAITGALREVRGLLKHGISLARGKAHEHHSHKKHDHATPTQKLAVM